MSNITDLTTLAPYFPDWKIDESDNGIYLSLVHPSEAQLIFRIKGGKRSHARRAYRLWVWACYDINNEDLTSYLSVFERNELKEQISCSRTRSVRAIAKDIQRRLVAEYLEKFAVYKQRYLQRQADKEKARSQAAELAAIIRTTPNQYSPNCFFKMYSGSPEEHSFSIQGRTSSYQGGSVELELNRLTFEQAEFILKYLHSKWFSAHRTLRGER